MTPQISDFLDPHGGLTDNNLLHSLNQDDIDYEDDTDPQLHFKLSEYFDIDSIKAYSIRNQNSINIMSLNAESLFKNMIN